MSKRVTKKKNISIISTSDSEDELEAKPKNVKRKLKEKTEEDKAPKPKKAKLNSKKVTTKYDIPTSSNNNLSTSWEIHELLSEQFSLDIARCRNIVRLFEGDNTIPFICRYRKEVVGEVLTPEKMRDIKTAYNHILELKSKIIKTINNLESRNLLNNELKCTLLCVRNLDELELVVCMNYISYFRQINI